MAMEVRLVNQALANGEPKHWMTDSLEVRDTSTFQEYGSSLSARQVVSRVAIVAAHVCVGAGVGAGIFGMGAAPAAGVGAGVGLVFGIGAVSVYDYGEYKAYRKGLSVQGRDEIDEVFGEFFNQDTICALTLCVPLVPVRLHGEKQIYERAALEEHLEKYHNSPLTRKHFGQNDVVFAIDGITRIGVVCNFILETPGRMAALSPQIIQGIKILRKESLVAAEAYRKSESVNLIELMQAGGLTPDQLAERSRALANVLNPRPDQDALRPEPGQGVARARHAAEVMERPVSAQSVEDACSALCAQLQKCKVKNQNKLRALEEESLRTGVRDINELKALRKTIVALKRKIAALSAASEEEKE